MLMKIIVIPRVLDTQFISTVQSLVEHDHIIPLASATAAKPYSTDSSELPADNYQMSEWSGLSVCKQHSSLTLRIGYFQIY